LKQISSSHLSSFGSHNEAVSERTAGVLWLKLNWKTHFTH